MEFTGKKVLVTGDLVSSEKLEELKELGFEVVNPPHSIAPKVLSEAALADLLTDVDAYIDGGDELVTRDALQNASRLKLISFLGTDYEALIDSKAVADLGILLANTPGVNSNSVAEYVVGLLLNETRKIVEACTPVSDKSLIRQNRIDLCDTKVGILGMGNIGSRVTEILYHGFGTSCFYFSRSRKRQLESRWNLEYMDLPDLLGQVDALVICLPGNAATQNLISLDLLNKSKPKNLNIVCVSPSSVFVPEAIKFGFETGMIEGMSYDGLYDQRSKEMRELVEHPKFTLSSHVAAVTESARNAMADQAISSALSALKNEPFENLVVA